MTKVGLPPRRLVLAAALLLVPILVGVAAWRIVALQQSTSDARAHLSAAQQTLRTLPLAGERDSARAPSPAPEATSGLPGATARLASVCADVASADVALRDVSGQVQSIGPLLSAVEALPGVGERARSEAGALAAGTDLASAGTTLCQGLGPLSSLVTSADGATGGTATDTLGSLVAARPALLEAADKLQRLQASLDAMPSGAGLDEASQQNVAALRRSAPALIQGLRDGATLLDLLGGQGTRRFLVVSQNPDELRATGGYIGSVGVLETESGRVRLVRYRSSRAFDTPRELRVVPPTSFAPYLGTGYWHLAGANWWPSFPDSARQIESFYQLSVPDEPVDGVVALDQVGMAHLLAALGPVTVADYGETVSADTVQAALDRHLHLQHDDDEDVRKAFTGALASAVLQRALAAPRAALPDLVQAVRRSLDEQHLLIFANRSDVARVLAARRWDGGLLPSDGDYLMLVESDIAGTKDSQLVTRDAQYQVDLAAPDGPRAHLAITYVNTAPQANRPSLPTSPVYRTLLRVFAPAEAVLTGAHGFAAAAQAGQECARAVFSGEVTVPAGERAEVALDYRLPAAAVGPDGYHLVVQQQPGVPPGQLALTVRSAARPAATATLPDEPGHHAHWRLSGGENPALEAQPLPQPSSSDCGLAPVPAAKIAAPVQLAIPSIGLAAPIVELGVGDDGVIEAPETPDVVGWYRPSARAGQPGNSVMSGHVDWGTRTAVFWDLRRLQPGDEILVSGADEVAHRYVVEWNEAFPAGGAPVERLVGGSTDTVLTLITCDGIYDHSAKDYSNRRAVRARLTQ